MLAIALALGSSACYGVSNFIGPQLARRHAIVSVLVVSQVAALIGCALYLAADRGAALPAGSMLLALLAGAGNAAGLIGFYKAAELGPLSVVAPIGATGAIVPVVWGLATGDALKATQVVGVVLAMGGAALAARGEAEVPGIEPRYSDPRASALLGGGLGRGVRRVPHGAPEGVRGRPRLGALRRAHRARGAAGAVGGTAARRHPAQRPRRAAARDPGPVARGRDRALHGRRRPRPALARVGGRARCSPSSPSASAWPCWASACRARRRSAWRRR